jgi:serine beta-lactamase-like protein LACTB, mitochondrial
VRVTERSRFRTASVAKPITATAASALAADGRLNLDALSHRSGIRHYKSETLDDPEVSSTRHYAKLSDAFELFGKDPLVHQPGSAFLYSTFDIPCLVLFLEARLANPLPRC